MTISQNQARDLAEMYLKLSHELGEYRFAKWNEIAPAERQIIENAEWDLLNYSSSFITAAVGIALANMDEDLDAIKRAIGSAREAIKKIEEVKDVMHVTTAIIVLGGAIASRNPSAIAKAAADAIGVAKK